MTIWIESDLCDGCGRCLRNCPYDAIDLADGKAAILERCTNCMACLATCKNEAILTDAEPRQIPDFSDRKGIWIFAEQRDGELTPVSLELLGKAQELADVLNEDVSALLLGDGVAHLADTLFQYGAKRVYLFEHKELQTYRTNAYTAAVSDLVLSEKPNIFLLGATHIGRDLAPRVSRRVGSGLTADCTGLDVDSTEGILLQTRPAFGGNIMATIANRYSRPQMATVRPGVMAACPVTQTRKKIIRQEPDFSEENIGVNILETIKEKKRRVDLGQAKIIVAGGRGVGNTEGFNLLQRLADVLGGEVAGTRVTVEEGWISAENQVGQTGQSVRPDLYIACGISGAIQHRAGMMNSKYIVAVNKDARAPIFEIADWRIVGDLHVVVPELIKQLGDIKNEEACR